VRPSELVFELSDDPQIRVEVQAKVPGPRLDLGRAALTLDVQQAFDGADGLEAYERLLHDVMLRERLLFTRSEQIERLWEVCAPVIDDPPELQPYPRGSWGPEAALELPASPGWRLPDGDGAAVSSAAARPGLAALP
jgi:glucose-6-phosphate 1-dehydrogenase